jgi:hypothetical protein
MPLAALPRAISIVMLGPMAVSVFSVAVGCRERREAAADSAAAAGAARSRPADVGHAIGGEPVGSDALRSALEPSRENDAGLVEPRCRQQPPQEFLVSAHLKNGPCSPAEAAERRAALARAIRYRTEQYGYFEGFGNAAWNPKAASEQVGWTTFFGVPVRLHERVIPVLQCVEKELRRECNEPYQPRVLSGFRRRNTYLSGEVSNHVYGIALDIDPGRNPCCGCIEPWRSNKRCEGKRSVAERMDMPQCWVRVFERYGFYWLGHDELEDSMHFEFLGDPSEISEAGAAADDPEQP